MFTKKIFSSAKESFRIKTDKVVFLGHGIDVDIFPNTFHIYTGNTLKIVHIGRITQIKNIEIAISAVHELNKYSVSAELTLFGVCETEADKSYKKVLENLIIEKGLVGSVLFAGGIIHTDLASKLSNSHIAVNMTPPGGMDKVVLESLLVGIPAFTSNTAFNCLFREYENLFFYNFRDSVELSKKIYNFIQMQNRQDITEILSNRVRNNFSLTVLVEKMVNIMK